MGQVGGMAINIITVAWLVFAIVFFSFPYYMPVTGESPVSSFLYFCGENERKRRERERERSFSDFPLASNMNYTCACVGGFLIIELLWWFIAGKEYSQTMQKARQEEANAARAMMVDQGEK